MSIKSLIILFLLQILCIFPALSVADEVLRVALVLDFEDMTTEIPGATVNANPAKRAINSDWARKEFREFIPIEFESLTGASDTDEIPTIEVVEWDATILREMGIKSHKPRPRRGHVNRLIHKSKKKRRDDNIEAIVVVRLITTDLDWTAKWYAVDLRNHRKKSLTGHAKGVSGSGAGFVEKIEAVPYEIAKSFRQEFLQPDKTVIVTGCFVLYADSKIVDTGKTDALVNEFPDRLSFELVKIISPASNGVSTLETKYAVLSAGTVSNSSTVCSNSNQAPDPDSLMRRGHADCVISGNMRIVVKDTRISAIDFVVEHHISGDHPRDRSWDYIYSATNENIAPDLVAPQIAPLVATKLREDKVLGSDGTER